MCWSQVVLPADCVHLFPALFGELMIAWNCQSGSIDIKEIGKLYKSSHHCLGVHPRPVESESAVWQDSWVINIEKLCPTPQNSHYPFSYEHMSPILKQNNSKIIVCTVQLLPCPLPFILFFESVFLKCFSSYNVMPIHCRKLGKHGPQLDELLADRRESSQTEASWFPDSSIAWGGNNRFCKSPFRRWMCGPVKAPARRGLIAQRPTERLQVTEG